MGYNLYIGEASVQSDLEERSTRIVVEGKCIDESPLNSNDEHTNGVYPSYTQWTDFTRRTGLYAVFYAGGRGSEAQSTPWFKGESGREYDGLLSSHPGAVELTEDHYKAFVAAQQRYIASGDATDPYDAKRLDWLVWWTRWALDNCEYPTFQNS